MTRTLLIAIASFAAGLAVARFPVARADDRAVCASCESCHSRIVFDRAPKNVRVIPLRRP